jgi:hypothetical protein
VLCSEEGKTLKERLGKKLQILQKQLVEAASDKDQLVKFLDFHYKLKIGRTLFSKISQDLNFDAPISPPVVKLESIERPLNGRKLGQKVTAAQNGLITDKVSQKNG